MSDLAARFKAASEAVTELNEPPTTQDKLKLYGLFKQATDGDVTGDRPGALNFVAQAKYDGWAKFKGKTSDEAMQLYIDLVEELKKNDS
ncbi:acyl-CoA-binding protein [Andreprevotia chitinilytica]|uniref:acyl-CoA-binding protein n=1 Tax=Andreprevotia chitinilytica TaxID=396808 RepID=UPI000556A285|nr:acyl-CoA-binding protein [Andreprevotia chitinilytica]